MDNLVSLVHNPYLPVAFNVGHLARALVAAWAGSEMTFSRHLTDRNSDKFFARVQAGSESNRQNSKDP